MANQLFKHAKSLFGGEDVSPPMVVTPRKPVRKFHAVSIVPGPRACAAARELDGPAVPVRRRPAAAGMQANGNR